MSDDGEEDLTDAALQMAEDAENFSITLNELADRDLTMREVALLINNHARALSLLDKIIEYQEQRITTMMFTLAAYLKQYPLDLDKLQAGDMSALTTETHVESEHFEPGGYL